MQDEERKKLLTENSSVMNIIRLGLTSKLFRKYLSNKANAKEQEMVESWDAEAYWNRYLKKIPDSELEKGCKKVWEEVSNQIHTVDPSVEYGQYPVAKPTTSIAQILFPHAIRKYAAMAAMFLLVAGTTLFFMTRQTNSNTFTAQQVLTKTYFQTGISNIKIVKLPDGSKITLNSGTRLSIVENQFNCKLREVWLSGEAFFEVAKNPEKPFIIHTGAMQTTVRGTSFNVKAYPQLTDNVVSVRSGKVEVSAATQTFGILTHNKQLTYNTANKKTQITESDWKDAAGWMEGRMVFNNASIKEIQLRLKQHYGLEMEVTGNTLKDVQCNAGFRKGASAEEVLERISALYNVKYEIKTNRVFFYN